MQKIIPEEQFFEYGDKEAEWLKSQDPILAKAVNEIGHIYRPVIPDLFEALVNCIIGQQISSKAHKTIWNRLNERFPLISPESIAAVQTEDLQSCGITMRKARYIKEITESVLTGELDLEHLNSLSDDEVRSSLCKIKGIGNWTADMLMIFSMQRMNIISYGDLGILRGLRMLYHHRKITVQLFAKYKRRYSPYASVASLYLWAISAGACNGLTDYVHKNQKKRRWASV
jgi:DNA-3-methyladenine glycosylase II